jgi:hypothetical protein
LKIVCAFPPNIDEIAAAIPAARTGDAIFCYGGTIYNPSSGKITPALKAHEAVHSARQGNTDEEVRAWWRRYLADTQFRLDEELLAHQAEYAEFCRLERDKEKRFRFLVSVAKRLSGPLYGGLMSFDAAKNAIRSH